MVEKKIDIVTFRTNRYPYAYDRHTNTIATLTEDEYNELRQIENDELEANQGSAINK